MTKTRLFDWNPDETESYSKRYHENIYVCLTLWILMRRIVDLPFNKSNDRVEALKQIHFGGKNYFGELVITSERRTYLQTPRVHEFDDYLLLFANPRFLSR